MEHTNLLYYETHSALTIDYPDEKVTSPRPGVAYARDDKKVIFNKKKVTYEVAVNYEDRSGNTLASGTTINTPEALEGNTAKVVIYPVEIEDAKPVSLSQKITVSADTEYTFLYYVLTSYTVTVNHIYSGAAIACATTIVVSGDVYEEDVVKVTIEPEDIPGYTAETVTISVSGDCEYDLEYELGCPDYNFVDLGLPSGTLWATKNVGACNPEDYGDYYAWGEIETKSTYTVNNYRFYDANNDTFTKYTSNDGLVRLVDADDVAHVKVGGEAYMPTSDEWNELCNYTNKEFVEVNGVVCVKFTAQQSGGDVDRGSNDTKGGDDVPYIIIPCAGWRIDDIEGGDEVIKADEGVLAKGGTKSGEGDYAALWTSERYDEGGGVVVRGDNSALHIEFYPGGVENISVAKGETRGVGDYVAYELGSLNKPYGLSVRPVIPGATPSPSPAE